MSAPAREPSYYNWGEPSLEPRRALGYLVDNFASLVRYFPDWIVEETGRLVDLTLVAHEPGEGCVIGFAAVGISGTVRFTPDASGWMLVTAETGGTEMFRAYLDRPYEQYEIWPPGATPGPQDEGPGRIGKREQWVGLDTAYWPALRGLANAEGHIFIQVDETRLRMRMQREEELRKQMP